jgi:cytochrome b561
LPGYRDRYDIVTIWLHWLTAGLVIALWLEAQVIDAFGHGGSAEVYMRSLHITLGVSFAVVLAFRLLWRWTGARRPATAENDLLERIAHVTHYLLYILAGITLVLGCLTVWMQGDSIWNLFTVPAYDSANIRAMSRLMRGWHGTAANAILILAGLHAAAALFHHYLLRDNVLRRMLPP